MRLRPASIVRPLSPRVVQETAWVASDSRIRLSVFSGHDWAGRAMCDGGLVIDLSGMRSVTVDVRAGVATVVGGYRGWRNRGSRTLRFRCRRGRLRRCGYDRGDLGGGYGPRSGRFGLQPTTSSVPR